MKTCPLSSEASNRSAIPSTALGGGCRGQRGVGNLIRNWASPDDADLLMALQDAFVQRTPGVQFENTFHGPESAIAGVYTGVADLAWMAREIRDRQEIMAYQWVLLEEPFQLEFAHGGITGSAQSEQLGVFVNRANALSRISLVELDSILGHECRRGGVPIRNWAQLAHAPAGLGAAILPCTAPVDSVEMLFVRHECLLNSFKWNPGIRQIGTGWTDISAEIAGNADAIGILPMSFETEDIRCVPLSFDEQSRPVAPTRETVRTRIYPLARTRSLVVQPKKMVRETPVFDFLRFLLSDEGQAIIDDQSRLFSLHPDFRASALRRLEA
jgi:phosphate transport system substrate-binding protein